MIQQKSRDLHDTQPAIPVITWSLLAGTVFGKLVYKSTIPFLSLFLLRHDHLSAMTIGFILGMSYLAGVFSSLYAGYLTDRFGHRRIMLISLVILALAISMIPVLQSVPFIAAVIAIVGLFRNSFETSNQSMVVHVTPVPRQSEVLSIRYACVNFAAGLGPLIGAWLGYSGEPSSFLINGVGYLAYTVVLFVLTRQSSGIGATTEAKQVHPMKLAYQDIAKNRTFLVGLLSACMLTYGFIQIDVTLPQVLAAHSNAAVHWFAWILALNTAINIIFQIPLIRFLKRFPKRKTMMVGAVVSAFGYICFGLAQHLLTYLMAMAVTTMGEMLSLTLIVPYLVEVSNPNHRGAYFGAGRLRFLGDFAGSAIGGILLQHFGAFSLFGSTAVLVASASLWLAVGRHEIRAESDS